MGMWWMINSWIMIVGTLLLKTNFVNFVRHLLFFICKLYITTVNKNNCCDMWSTVTPAISYFFIKKGRVSLISIYK